MASSSLTLVELLDQPQPYKELNRLNDRELKAVDPENDVVLSRIQGSLIGLAVGDALGAHVEFRPKAYLDAHPVSEMQSGGTWGLEAGQFTDDTSMALCLAASLIARGGFNGYDQLVRYRRWFQDGYMSSTGRCFDIGTATRDALIEFNKRCEDSKKKLPKQSNSTGLADELEHTVDLNCSNDEAAGNGALMRLAPVPLFYHDSKSDAIIRAGESARFTHGSPKAIDACRFYSALIWEAIHGLPKAKLLDSKFASKRFKDPLYPDVKEIAEGSYKKKPNGYADGIRGTGYIVNALEAALWAFAHDEGSFQVGVLKAINLGDDTDTTAAIYGQLAGAVYGVEAIPQHWREQLFQREFLLTIANGLYVKGQNVNRPKRKNEEETNGASSSSKKARVIYEEA